MKRSLNSDKKSGSLRLLIENDSLDKLLSEKKNNLVQYAKRFTLELNTINPTDLEQLKNVGYDDGETLEANQVVANFNYASRTVIGRGVNTDNEVLDLSPNNKGDESSWGHKWLTHFSQK